MVTTDLHPADQVHADRLARLGPRFVVGIDQVFTTQDKCEHGRAIAECLICLQLRHAEERSVTVRAIYAAGDWPPPAADEVAA